MRFQGFIGPSYQLQSLSVDCQRTVNLYPEIDEAGTGKEGEIASFVSTPGLRLLTALPTGPLRGVYTDSTDQLWAVGGNVLYKVSTLWVATSVGTLNTSLGPVSFSDNGFDVVLVDGPYGYHFNFASQTLAQITDPNFQGATQVTYMDGYLIFNKPNSEQFYLSGLNALTFNGADVGTAEAFPDNIVGQIVAQEYLYLFGTQALEVYYDSGNTFPFDRVQGAVIEIGLMAAFSLANIGGQVFWLGQDKNGRGVVYRAQGFQPQRISTFAIENVIRGLGDLSGARAFTYQQGGHAFYCLNLTGASSTWVYDVATGQWHERAYLAAGQYQRHPADCHTYAYSTNVVGDYSSGKLYALDPAARTDNGNPIVWERTSPHLSKDGNRIFHNSFELDMEVGVGLDGVGHGTDPQVMLQWSDDHGGSWSNEHWASAGKIGARKTRVKWRRLGRARDRVYRVRGSDPVKTTLIGANLDVEEGAS